MAIGDFNKLYCGRWGGNEWGLAIIRGTEYA